MSFDKKYLTMIYLRGQEEEATAGTDATVARSITRKPTLKDLIIFVTKPLADKLLCVQMVQSFYTYSVVYITDTCCKKLFKLKTGGQELQGVSCISSTLQRCELLIDKGAEMDTLHRGHALYVVLLHRDSFNFYSDFTSSYNWGQRLVRTTFSS
eukprot:Filipodium_phascolosomae@DN1892_c0_g1_i3.p1